MSEAGITACSSLLLSNVVTKLVVLLRLHCTVANVDVLSAYNPVGSPTWLETFSDVGLSPPRAWWVSSFSWYDIVNGIRNKDIVFSNRLTAVVTGQGILAAAAWLLWRLACRRFRRESAQRRA